MSDAVMTIRSSALMNNRAGEVSLGHAAWITPLSRDL